MNLSVTVMAHPVRRGSALALADALGCHVVWATNPEPSTDPADRWDTARRAWLNHDPASDWHLVIQDDAIIAPGVTRDVIAGMLSHVPPTVTSLYLGTHRPAQLRWQRLVAEAERVGASFIEGVSLSWGVAVACPTADVEDMIEWCDRLNVAIDTRIGQYWRVERGLPCWYPWPSLVDHDDATPSLVGHKPGRVAHKTTADAAAATWDGPTIVDPRTKSRNHRRSRVPSARRR